MSYSYLTKTQWGQKSSCLICFFSRQHCVLAEVIWTFILTLCSFIKSRGFFLMSYIHVSFPPICQISFNCALYFTCLVFVLYYAYTGTLSWGPFGLAGWLSIGVGELQVPVWTAPKVAFSLDPQCPAMAPCCQWWEYVCIYGGWEIDRFFLCF